MSWHTSVILIQEPRPADLGAVLERLGFARGTPRKTISFEDATSSHAPGKSVAHTAAWTIVCDPEFFISHDAPDLAENQLWSRTLDERLRGISAAGSTVFGFITEGATSTHGFTLYRSGDRVRMWLMQGRELLIDEGEPLPEESECFGHGGPFDAEQGLLMLMGELALPMMELEEVEFQVFGLVQEDDHLEQLLQSAAPPVESIPKLITLLRDPNCFLSSQAASALTRIGPPAASAIPAMIERLSSDDEDVRGSMAHSLGDFGRLAKDAVPSLIKLLQDKGRYFFQGKKCYPVRFRAAFALARIDPNREEIIPVLREALHYKNKPEYIVDEAFEVLTKRMGTKSHLFIPELRADENNPDLMQRMRVQIALAQLVPGYVIADEHIKPLWDTLKCHLAEEKNRKSTADHSF